jgi:hypothetical protein
MFKAPASGYTGHEESGRSPEKEAEVYPMVYSSVEYSGSNDAKK